TTCATPTPIGWNGASSRGTIDSSVVGGDEVPPASGIAWSPAHWSRCVVAPVATSAANAAKAAAAANAALRSGHPEPQRRGNHLEARRRRPDRLAVDLERQRLVRADPHGGGAQKLHLRVRE